MSYVIAMPELMQDAADNLAGIRSALAAVAADIAGPTTGIAAAAQDEVSVALASLFGNFGNEFQVLNAQAQAFHDQFVNLMRAGTGAYLSTETANVEQALLNGPAADMVAPVVAEAQALSQFGTTVVAPYQALYADTAANLQSLENAVLQDPAPFLRQLVANQVGYGQAIAGAIQTLPANVANLPAALEALVPADPAGVLQGIVNQQIGYAQTVATALGSAAQDFGAGVAGLPAGFQAAVGDLVAGNAPAAVRDIATSYGNLFLTGLTANQDMTTFLINITPAGTLGDLLPILAIPGQMAQNFTNLLPVGSVPGVISQHFTNLLLTLSDTSQTLDLNTGILHVGLPLVLGLDAIGPAATAVNALGSSATAFVNAVQIGDGLGAAAALLDAPAVVANGFLNGHATLPLSVALGELTTTTNIPLGGILTPGQFASLTLEVFGMSGTLPLFGTPFGGILPALLTFLPEQLAQAIGAPVPV
ncbi:PE family protein [Mycobacterium sp. 1423905.2]|uniref:PE family protein n=1 Tax=Mycobacterium sp. 1423905.2 TaxID=1856859 RepID=UPI0007FBD8FD|nr:PE family protein [Mycobacterium sp. 1423905.2]OBJ55331.1 hypothetical protein A9W95_15250 [Mycobacterium sp. 1423905.2]